MLWKRKKEETHYCEKKEKHWRNAMKWQEKEWDGLMHRMTFGRCPCHCDHRTNNYPWKMRKKEVHQEEKIAFFYRECLERNAWRKNEFLVKQWMECWTLFCFWKIKENENPKRRFVEQETLIGVHAPCRSPHNTFHIEHAIWFFTELSEGLRLFSLVLNGVQMPMHHDRDIDHPVGLLHFAELPQFLNILVIWANLSLHHTRQCTESVAPRQFSAHPFEPHYV